MAGKGGQRKGLGFGAGVITGLAFSAVVLSGLSLSVPLQQTIDVPEREAPPEPRAEASGTEPDTAGPEAPVMREAAPAADRTATEEDTSSSTAEMAAPATGETVQEDGDGATSPLAPEVSPLPDEDTESAAEMQPASGDAKVSNAMQDEAEVGTEPAQELPVADEATVATEVGPDQTPDRVATVEAPAERAPVETAPDDAPVIRPESDATPEGDPVEEADPGAEAATAENDASPEVDEGPAPAAESAAPVWRANAAIADLVADEPVMTVIVTGARAGTLPALTTLAPLSAVTVAMAPDAEDKAGLATALRALGHEVLETVPADAPSLSVPLSAGLAVAGVADAAVADAVLAAAESNGALAVDLLRGGASPLVEAGRAAGQPVAGAALRITAERTATEAFQTLRDAAALAAREGTLVVTLETSPATLTALGRWLALPGDAQPAPLTALIGRLGATRY